MLADGGIRVGELGIGGDGSAGDVGHEALLHPVVTRLGGSRRLALVNDPLQQQWPAISSHQRQQHKRRRLGQGTAEAADLLALLAVRGCDPGPAFALEDVGPLEDLLAQPLELHRLGCTDDEPFAVATTEPLLNVCKRAAGGQAVVALHLAVEGDLGLALLELDGGAELAGLDVLALTRPLPRQQRRRDRPLQA